jgi:hypothetical protein
MGKEALQANTTASNNTAVGYQAGYSNTTGAQNTYLGYQTGYSGNGSYNVHLGYLAGQTVTGSFNIAIGGSSQGSGLSSGGQNVSMGQESMQYVGAGGNNTSIGHQSSRYLTTGSNNVALGYFSYRGDGTTAPTGGYNTAVGPSAGYLMTSGSKNTILGGYSGNQGGLDIRTASNYIVLSDGDGNPFVYGKYNSDVVLNTSTGGTLYCLGAYTFTTASSANLFVNSGGAFLRSTSALKYKQNVRDLEDMDISLLRPVRYKSKCENDDQTKDHLGLIADEAADVGFEELVSRGADGEIEGFQYERLTVVLLKSLQSLKAEFDAYKATHP